MNDLRVLRYVKFLILMSFVLVLFQETNAQTTETPTNITGRPPVIIIPGLIGSELINKDTNEEVWFNLARSKDDDMRLPISPNIVGNRDKLIPRDILRSIKIARFLPESEVYEKLIASLQQNGYTEGKWANPSVNGYEDSFYVFAYDWRRDNVENARILMRQIKSLKAKLKRPNLKFNIVAHSMGGLIARYATRFGDADLPRGNARPRITWKGAADISRVFLVGTPNEGSTNSLSSLVNGFSLLGGKLNIPFVQNLSKFDLFTIPSVFQLLPHDGALQAFDEDLKPLNLDIYDVATWEKYEWAAYLDKDFSKKISNSTERNARAYLRAVLARAKKLHQALDTDLGIKTPVPIYFLGADCKPTLDGFVIHRNEKKDRWETLFKPAGFTKTDGTKVPAKDVETVLYSPGDGVVSKRSFVFATLTTRDKITVPISENTFICDEHNKLTGNADIQKVMFTILNAK